MAAPTPDQIEDAYRRYFPVIARKCGRMLRNPTEAQDVAQEVFLRLWKSRLELRDAGATTAWLYRTCTHLAIELIRARARHGESPSELADALASPGPGVEDQTDHRRKLAELVGALPQDELEAALLSRVDRLTHPEIGEVLGVSERTVRRLLTRLDERLAPWRARGEEAA